MKRSLQVRAKTQSTSRKTVYLIVSAVILAAVMLIPTKLFAYDTYWGYFVCYNENTRGKIGSCVISNKICNASYLHYYGQYNNRYEQKDGLLRCHYDRKSVVDPVARMWLH